MTDRDYSDDHRGPPHPPAQTDFPSLLRAGYFGRSRAARLREWAEDPMWADHAEVPKLLCSEAANEIDLLRAALAAGGGRFERGVRRLLAWWRAAGPDHATPSGGQEAGPQEDRIEAAYWRFDARHKGYGQWKQAPMSERDAFKAEMRNALEAEKTRAEMRLVAKGWRRPGA